MERRTFFFSSRRRHTIWNCDWSSDVCSSDLGRPALTLPVLARRHRERQVLELVLPLGIHAPEHVGDPADACLAEDETQAAMALERAREDHRSEERRVGKEWRAGVWQYD